MNFAIISLGSNIEPEKNIRKSKAILSAEFRVLRETIPVKTKPMEFKQQPDFINMAILVETRKTLQELNKKLKETEKLLGRIKTENKAGPRTIDLDAVVWNLKLKDRHVLEWPFLKASVKELLPELLNKTGKRAPNWAKQI